MLNAIGRGSFRDIKVLNILLVTAVIILSIIFGLNASYSLLFLVLVLIATVISLRSPLLIVMVLPLIALALPIRIDTGTDVQLNGFVLALPIAAAIWLLNRVVNRRLRFVYSKTLLPLLLFLLSALISMFIGNVLWDPLVPRAANLTLVQLAQWAIFALSALAYILAANLLDNEAKLKSLVKVFLLAAGTLSILGLLFGMRNLINQPATIAIIRTPLWILFTAIAGGQLLFNKKLSFRWRIFVMTSLLGVVAFAFFQDRDSVSNWTGIATVLLALVWLRWPKIRIPVVILVLLLIATGLLLPTIWEFGGGEIEWQRSGGSRLVLIQRVVEVSMRNPITGLGPAAYRSYAGIEPLAYGRAFYTFPMVNSHNNYVDIFSQTGIIGLGLFIWFLGEVVFLGWRITKRYTRGFTAGYANAILASVAGIVVIMLFLDWFLPFVYNVGFPGFQASGLVWLFMGGLVAIDNWDNKEPQILANDI